jgi:hypothetical protein
LKKFLSSKRFRKAINFAILMIKLRQNHQTTKMLIWKMIVMMTHS